MKMLVIRPRSGRIVIKGACLLIGPDRGIKPGPPFESWKHMGQWMKDRTMECSATWQVLPGRRLPAGLALILAMALGVAGMGGCRAATRVEPAKRIAEGWNWYRSGDFGPAMEAFEAALDGAGTNDTLRQQAWYGLATTWNLRRPDEDPDRATACYREAIAVAPASDLAAWSWLALARMRTRPVAGEDVEAKEQVRAYQDVIDRFPFHPAGEEAFLFQQAARITLMPGTNETHAVLDALGTFLTTHPATPWRSAAWRLVAHCCDVLRLKERRLAAALEEWKTKEVDPLNPNQDLALTYWRIATLAEFEVGDFAMAREYYSGLITNYPTEQRVFPAKQELKRMDDLETSLKGPAR